MVAFKGRRRASSYRARTSMRLLAQK